MRLHTIAEAVSAAHGRRSIEDDPGELPLHHAPETHANAAPAASLSGASAAETHAPAANDPMAGIPPADPRIVAQVTPPPVPPAPAAPTASPQQLAMVDLALSDPLNQQLIQAYAPNAVTATGDIARDQAALYGAERFGKMQQLAQATASVRNQYLAALDAAQQAEPPAIIQEGVMGTSAQELAASAPPLPVGWHYDVSVDGEHTTTFRAQFDVDAFTAWYAKQDTLASHAFATLYGGSSTTQEAHGGEQIVNRTMVGGEMFQAQQGYWSQIGEHGEKSGWVGSQAVYSGPVAVIDAQGHPDLINSQAVWFDPAMGFVTLRDNIKQKQNFLDKALPSLAAIGITAVTAGAGAFSSIGTTAGGGLAGTMASAAAMSALTTLNSSLLANCSVHLKDVLKSALTGAVTASLTNVAGLDKLGLQGNTVVSYADRAIAITGQATLQGALQQLAGGKFKDGFTAGLASGLAAEVTRGMQAGIDAKVKLGQMSGAEASACRLLTQATGSAIRMLSSPNDPGRAMAQDFLGSLVQDGAAAISQPAPMTLDQLRQSEITQGNAQAAPQALPSAPAPVPAPEAAPAPTAQTPAPAPADDANAAAAAPASQPAKVVGVNEDGQKIVATTTISWVGNIRPIDGTGVYLDRKQVPVEATDLQAFQDDSGRQFWGYKVNGEQQYAYMPPPGQEAQLPAPASPVPEPGTLALAGAGAGTIAVRPLVPTIVEAVVTVGRTIIVTAAESELLLVGIAAGTINMLFPSSAGRVEITEIDDNRRLVKPTDELYGVVQERDANGQWKTIGNMATLHSDGKLEMTVPTPEDEQRAIREPRGIPADPPPRRPIPPYGPPDNEGKTRIEGKQSDGLAGPTIEVLPAPPPRTIGDTTFDRNSDNNRDKAAERYNNNPSLQDPSKLAGTTVQGVGTWGYPDQPRSASGADYQEQLQGVPAGLELNVGGTRQANGVITGGAWMDGYEVRNGQTVLIDRKDWVNYPPAGVNFWHGDVLNEAKRQLDAVAGTGAKIEWQFSTQRSADVVQDLLDAQSNKQFKDIKIRVVPKQ